MAAKPEVDTRYPRNWKEIQKRIRDDRAQGRCERCGARNLMEHPVNGKRTVLAVAHLDHDRGNNADDNLACLCQLCHLAHDNKRHHESLAKTRARLKSQKRATQVQNVV